MRSSIIIPLQLKCLGKTNQHQAKTISVSYIQKSIEKAKMNPGDLYDKAAQLLIELTHIHAFESG